MSVDLNTVKIRIDEVINEYGTGQQYAIFPYGEWGRMVKSVLNFDYKIDDVVIIDNSLARKHAEVINIDSLMEERKKYQDMVILLSSVRSELHDELLSLVKRTDIRYIDLFKEESDQEKSEKSLGKAAEERTLKALKKAAIIGIKNNFYYRPIHTNSMFYLPYMFSDCIQQEIFLRDDYKDKNTLRYIFYEFKEGAIGKYVKNSTVIDAGANIGNHTLYFMNEVKFNYCYSFEPVEQTFEILEENIDINNLREKVFSHKVGLGSENTRGRVLTYNFSNIGGTALEAGCSTGDVEIRTLDSIDYFGKVRFIKIDVEGMELSVLKGGESTIKANRPVIMIESFDKYAEVEKLLSNYKYQNESLGPNDYLFYPEELVSRG